MELYTGLIVYSVVTMLLLIGILLLVWDVSRTTTKTAEYIKSPEEHPFSDRIRLMLEEMDKEDMDDETEDLPLDTDKDFLGYPHQPMIPEVGEVDHRKLSSLVQEFFRNNNNGYILSDASLNNIEVDTALNERYLKMLDNAGVAIEFEEEISNNSIEFLVDQMIVTIDISVRANVVN